MGHRMEFYVSEEVSEQIIELSRSFAVDAQLIGRVEESQEKKLTISSPMGTFNY